MTTKTVTLTLPPALMERAQLAATVLNHPLEEVLFRHVCNVRLACF